MKKKQRNYLRTDSVGPDSMFFPELPSDSGTF